MVIVGTCMSISLSLYIYIYIYTHTHTFVAEHDRVRMSWMSRVKHPRLRLSQKVTTQPTYLHDKWTATPGLGDGLHLELNNSINNNNNSRALETASISSWRVFWRSSHSESVMEHFSSRCFIFDVMYAYMYIYIYRERERDVYVCVSLSIYLSISLSLSIYIYIYIMLRYYW